MQREAKKQLQTTGVDTKSQEALKLQHEQCKQERKIRKGLLQFLFTQTEEMDSIIEKAKFGVMER